MEGWRINTDQHGSTSLTSLPLTSPERPGIGHSWSGPFFIGAVLLWSFQAIVLFMFRHPSSLSSLLNRSTARRATSLNQIRRWTTLTHTKDALTIHALKNTSFPYIWLRDSCQSEDCVHPSSRQKLHRTSDIPLDITPIEDGVQVTPTGIDITWSDGHQSSFDQDFLERHASTSKLAEWHHDNLLAEQSWTSGSISRTPNLFIPYDRVRTSSGLVDAITQLTKYGLLFVSGVFNKETSNETCELRTLAERFGEIRHTFYGLLWDVVNVPNSRNIAYTNLDLGLHMDLL